MEEPFRTEYIATNCPVCEESHYTPWRILRGEKTSKCLGCGHIFASPMPTEKSIIKAYQLPFEEFIRFFRCEYMDVKGYYYESYEWQRANAQKYMNKINALAPKRGKILELGCSSGIFLQVAKMSGWATTGVEPGNISQLSTDRDKDLNILRTDLFSANLDEGSFDFIFASSVIEHLTNPKLYLRKLNRLLKQGGGILIVGLPNINSLTIRLKIDRYIGNHPPLHLQYFSKYSIITLLKLAGFDQIKVTSYGISETILEFIFNRKGRIYTGSYTDLLNQRTLTSVLLNLIRNWIYTGLNFLDLGSVMEVQAINASSHESSPQVL